MKKLNITPGKWRVCSTDSEIGLILVNNEDEETVHDGFHFANARLYQPYLK